MNFGQNESYTQLTYERILDKSSNFQKFKLSKDFHQKFVIKSSRYQKRVFVCVYFFVLVLGKSSSYQKFEFSRDFSLKGCKSRKNLS